MTPDASGWRSSERYAHVADMTASDVAWEWLRRN
ncbi:transcriptional regulator domain-containing protein, partial [Escherichia fergusonii]